MVNVIYTLQIKLDGRKNRGNSKLLECSQKSMSLSHMIDNGRGNKGGSFPAMKKS